MLEFSRTYNPMWKIIPYQFKSLLKSKGMMLRMETQEHGLGDENAGEWKRRRLTWG